MERKVHIILRSILLIFIGALIVFSIGKVIFSKLNIASVPKSTVDDVVQPQDDIAIDDEEETNINIKNPQSNEIVKSPLVVTGEARGWYFEGVFPVRILDSNNKEIGRGQVRAKGDWMKDAFVPFEGKIEFSQPTTKTGKLVFQKDNPSGLPENDENVEISVLFSK